MLARGLMNFIPTDDVYLPVRPTRFALWTRSQTSGCHGTLYTTSTASEIARRIGVSRAVLYKWKMKLSATVLTRLCVNITNLPWGRTRCVAGGSRPTESGNTPRQMELDILKKAEEIIKKDPGSVSATWTTEKKQRSLMPWDNISPDRITACSGPCP